MSLRLPRRRVILAFHRWLGLAAALFLLSLSLTGLALNHSETLGLDRVKVRWSFVLDRYGMASASEIRSYTAGEGIRVSYLDGRVFVGEAPVSAASEPLGVGREGDLLAVATRDAVLLVGPGGALVERIEGAALPSEPVEGLGRAADGALLVITAEGAWRPDGDWLGFTRFDGSWQPEVLDPAELAADRRAALLANYRGDGVPLYRVLLDLHSGRLFGLPGTLAMDLAAGAVLLLVASGIFGWLRKPQQRAQP